MMIKTCLVLLGTLILLPEMTSLIADGGDHSRQSVVPHNEAARLVVVNQSDGNFWRW